MVNLVNSSFPKDDHSATCSLASIISAQAINEDGTKTGINEMQQRDQQIFYIGTFSNQRSGVMCLKLVLRRKVSDRFWHHNLG